MFILYSVCVYCVCVHLCVIKNIAVLVARTYNLEKQYQMKERRKYIGADARVVGI